MDPNNQYYPPLEQQDGSEPVNNQQNYNYAGPDYAGQQPNAGYASPDYAGQQPDAGYGNPAYTGQQSYPAYGSANAVNQQPYLRYGNPELPETKKENVLAGAIGALLLSVVGGAIVFLLTRIHIIAGLAGLAGFLVTYWGYRKFSGSDGSKIGIVISIVFTLAGLLGGLYLGLVFDVYQETKDMGLSFSEAMTLTNSLIENDSEVKGDLIKNSLMLVGFTALACFGSVSSSLKKTKR